MTDDERTRLEEIEAQLADVPEDLRDSADATIAWLLALVRRQEAAQAAAAAMRQALERIPSLTKHEERTGYNDYCAKCVAEAALASDAGSTLLAELERLRTANARWCAELDEMHADEFLLIELFRSPEFAAEGRQGDHDGLRPYQTAVRLLKRLRAERYSLLRDREKLKAGVGGDADLLAELERLRAENASLTIQLQRVQAICKKIVES